MTLLNLLLTVLAAGPALPAARPPASAAAHTVWAETISVAHPGEAVARIRGACTGCSWERAGHEAAVLAVELDGRYSQHLVLVRGARPAEYAVSLGPLAAGAHRLRISLDRQLTPRGVTGARVTDVLVRVVGQGDPDHAAFAHTPVIYARPGSVARFSDVPLLTWYEVDALDAGPRLRYSVVFSNEDGGTPPDRLLATWGRLTDIEYVYGVELDAAGRVRSAELQGKDHKLRPFAGRREGAHPMLYVVTDNNMLEDQGTSLVRFAPAPARQDLAGVSREVVMDAEPWTYRVSAQEARREGRVDEAAQLGDKKIPDPRRFATLEACTPVEDATVAFEIGVRAPDGATLWYASDGGKPAFRIERAPIHFPTGCFRGAVALPAGVQAGALRALRVRAYTREAREGQAPVPEGAARARLVSVNRLFLLNEQDEPGPNLLTWRGDVALVPEGAPFEIAIEQKR
jgi:hypothetical protein